MNPALEARKPQSAGWPWLAMACALLLAIWLRRVGYDGRPLWVDELWRANLMLADRAFAQYWESPNSFTAITAPVYVLLNQFIALFDVSAFALRLSSWLPAVASVILAFAIVRRAGAGLLLSTFAAVAVAVNPQFIHYSNEFKPYMFEVMIHLVCLLVWLDVVGRPEISLRRWGVFFLTLAFAALCAANMVFLLPAMGLSVLWSMWGRWREFRVAIAGFALLGLFVILLYLLIWRHGPRDAGLITYWTESFHRGAQGWPRFAATKFGEMWRTGFATVGPGRRVDAVLAGLGVILSLVLAIRRRGFLVTWGASLLIFYSVFIATLYLLNALTLWPLGGIRPNQFVFAHTLLFFVLLLHAAASPRIGAGFAVLMLGVALWGAARAGHEALADLTPPLEQSDRVWADLQQDPVLSAAVQGGCHGATPVLLVNPAMVHALTYWSTVERRKGADPWRPACPKVLLMPDVYADPEGARRAIDAALESASSVQLLWSHLDTSEVDLLLDAVAAIGPVSQRVQFENAGHFVVSRPAR